MIRAIKQLLGRGGRGEIGDGPEVQSRILMVCMGNICRSPTAEGVLRSKLQQAGLGGRVLVDSAGTIATHAGEPPDPRAIAHAAARGYDLAAQRARPVRPDDFERFDWLLAMDEDNLAWLRQRAANGAAQRCALFLPFAGRQQAPLEVPDPYYGSPAGFDRVLDLVEGACDQLVAQMLRSPRLARAGEPGRA